MASKTIYKNANGIGSEITLVNPDSNNGKGKEVNLSKITSYVDTVDDLSSLTDKYETVIVKDKDRGGIFNAIASTTANGGTIFDGNGCSWERQYEGAVNVKWFGAVGDGVTDDTGAIQKAFDYASENNGSVEDGKGDIYLISTLSVKNGVRTINMTKGTIKTSGATNPDNLTTEAVIILKGLLTSEANPVRLADLSFRIDMSGGDRTAILGDGTSDCRFINNRIYGFTDDATYNHRGIRIQEGGKRNIIKENRIDGVDDPIQRGLLIDIWASLTGLPEFGGFFTGAISRATTPALYNIVSNNELIYGSYAVNLQGAEKNMIHNNVCQGQNHRSIYLANSALKNTITANECLDFKSSGVLLGYGSSGNYVGQNIFRNEGTIGLSGEAAVNIITGSSENTISGNIIDAPTNYGVYVATDSSFNKIIGNSIKNTYVAGIAVENDWIDTLPVGATYSRPNYAPPTDALPGATSWTFNDLEGTIIESNTILQGYTGRNIGAIYVSQIKNDLVGATETQTKNTKILNNTVSTMTNIGYVLTIYENTSNKMLDLYIKDNTFNPDTAIIDFRAATPSGAVDFIDLGLVEEENNGILSKIINGTPVKFVDGDTTPDVSGNVNGSQYYRFQNTALTNVTYFDGGYEGQEITFRGDANTRIIYGSGTIRTKDLVSTGSLSGNVTMTFKKYGTIWYEVSRSF